MAKITHTAPILMTKDPKGMAEFYCSKLGFADVELFGRPDAPVFAIVLRDGFQIMFRYVRDGRPRRPWVAASDAPVFDIYVTVDDIDSLYDDFLAADALPSAPEDREYGMREFKVVDPEGYVVAFGADIDSSRTGPNCTKDDD